MIEDVGDIRFFLAKNLCNMKQTQIVNSCRIVPVDHRVKLKESEKKDKYLNLARESKKLWNMKMTIIPLVIGDLRTVTKVLVKGLEDLEKNRTSGDHPNYGISEIGENTEKSHEDLRRLVITQTPVKNHHQT